MLETIVLDNTERLLAGVGERSQLSNSNNLIVSQSQMTCYGRQSKAAVPFTELYDFSIAGTQTPPAVWRSDANNVLLVADYTSSLNVIAINLGTGAMTQDSTARNFDYITEDASGVIWASCQTVANYGIWKRTGAGAWTKVLAATGANYLRRWSDNKLYWKDTAGNWYECTAGTVVVSADPSGGVANWWIYVQQTPMGNDAVCSYPLGYSGWKLDGLGSLPVTPDYYNSAAEQVSARYWPINAAGQTTGTKVAPLGNINWEFLSELTQLNVPNVASDALSNSASAAQHRFLRLDNTYMLHSCAMELNIGATARLPNLGARKIALNLLNKTTGVNKYIGSIYLTGSSTNSIGVANAANIIGNIIGARMTSGVLDLWIAQGTYVTGVASDQMGLFKKSLTLNLDF